MARSIRLTNAIRDNMKFSMLEHRFATRAGTIADRRRKLAHDIYHDLVIKKFGKEFKKLPDHFFQMKSTIQIYLGGMNVDLKLNGAENSARNSTILRCSGRDTVSLPMPYFLASYGSANCAFDVDHEFTKEFEEINMIYEALVAEYSEAESVVVSILHKFHTVRRLLEAWPEAAAFVPEQSKEAPALPAVPVAKLNAMLDLPQETENESKAA
jgi:hypothetical protein